MDFLKNVFDKGLDIGLLGVKDGVNFLGRCINLALDHSGASKNWNGNDKFVKDGNIQKRTVNRQNSNIMSIRSKTLDFLKETINDNSVNPELVNASRILLENYDLLNDNCISDLHRRWIKCINNRTNQQLGKYIVDIASDVKKEKVFSFLEKNEYNVNLKSNIREDIHLLLQNKNLLDRAEISRLYAVCQRSSRDGVGTTSHLMKEGLLTTAASRIKLQKVILILEDIKNINSLDRDILENIRALLHDRDLIDKEAINSLYSAITSNNGTAIKREITTAASRIKLQKVISILEGNKNNNRLNRDILEDIHVILQNGNLIDKEAISSLYSAITSNNAAAVKQEITTAASRIKLQKVILILEDIKNINSLDRDILENIRALLHDRDLIDKEAISSLYSAITSNNGTAITREITTAASRIKPRIVEIKLVKIVPKEDTDIEPSGEAAPPPIKQ